MKQKIVVLLIILLALLALGACNSADTTTVCNEELPQHLQEVSVPTVPEVTWDRCVTLEHKGGIYRTISEYQQADLKI